MSNYNNIEELENDLKKLKNFKLRLKKNYKPESLYELIKHCINLQNLYSELPKSYYLKGQTQCQFSSIGRGISDLYRIANYYFPETKIKDIFNVLKKININEKLRMQYCTDTKQTVVRIDNYIATSLISYPLIIRGNKFKKYEENKFKL